MPRLRHASTTDSSAGMIMGLSAAHRTDDFGKQTTPFRSALYVMKITIPGVFRHGAIPGNPRSYSQTGGYLYGHPGHRGPERSKLGCSPTRTSQITLIL